MINIFMINICSIRIIGAIIDNIVREFQDNSKKYN